MSKVLLDCDEGLYYHVLDFAHDSVRILALLPETLENFLEGAFVPRIVIYVLRCAELVTFFVDRIVC